VRAPNPHTNTYLAVAAFYQAMVDGMAWAAGSRKNAKELEADFSKKPGVAHEYLEAERAYRSEEDVFEHYDDRQREKLFGRPPATVWETLENLARSGDKAKVLSEDGVFTPAMIESYRRATLTRWTMELSNRVIPDNAVVVRGCMRLEGENALDRQRWEAIQALKDQLARDDVGRQSLFTRIRAGAAVQDYPAISALQVEMAGKMQELRALYATYRRNIGLA
jgi:glutamine synthetase